MLDESSFIQNHKGKTAQFILSLKPENVILLSGTPISGKFENMWSQLSLLGADIKYREFMHDYVKRTFLEKSSERDKKSGKIIRYYSYKDPETFKNYLKTNHCYLLKSSEVLELVPIDLNIQV